MKNLFKIFIIILLVSCGDKLEQPKSNTDHANIIGKPYRIDDLEIAQYDFPDKIIWSDAMKACNALGEGWRLPTKNELNKLYQNKYKIGSFTKNYYWSSSLVGLNSVWVQDFINGVQFSPSKNYDEHKIRAVKKGL